jgi:hypothetical protein
MGMTPDTYYEAFVLGNYEDCKSNPGCVRYAFNASVATSQLADQYFEYFRKNDNSKVQAYKKFGDFVEYLTKNTNGHFKDIRSISNAYKHLYTSLNPKKAIYSTISSTGAIESISFSDKNFDLIMIKEEFLNGLKDINENSIVVYTRKDGSIGEFLPALEIVIKFWAKLLYL